jgi:hypothetical protein
MRSGTIDAGNDIRLGFKKVSKLQAEAKVVSALNEEHGFDPLRALKPDSAELKKIGRQYPEYVEKVRASAKDKSTTAFKFWNEVGDPLEMVDEDSE